MEAEIEKFEPGAAASFRKYLVHSKQIFDTGFTKLGAVPFHKPLQMIGCVPDLIRLGNYKTVWQMASQYFKTEKLRRVFSFQPLLVGGNPFNTTSIYALIFYLEREWGVQFCMGGTGGIIRGLEKLMRDEGIDIRLNEEVGKITVTPPVRGNFTSADAAPINASMRKTHTQGVELKSGQKLPADIVVANADAPHVYKHLIEPRNAKGIAPRRVHSKLAPLKFSMGLFVMYFGTKKPYPNVAHHTIVLGESYKELIYRLFDKFDLETQDLSVYLHRPTCTDPTMAPAPMATGATSELLEPTKAPSPTVVRCLKKPS
jgi:phytoene desaturase